MYFLGVGLFVLKFIGDYVIYIFCDEKFIKGSFFYIKVGDKEFVYVLKVKVLGFIIKVKVNEFNILELDCSDVGRIKKLLVFWYIN